MNIQEGANAMKIRGMWRPGQGERPRGIIPAVAAGLLALSACDLTPREGQATHAALTPLTALEQVEAPTARGSGEPNLHAAADGQVYLSWFEPLGDGRHALRFSVMDPGAGGVLGDLGSTDAAPAPGTGAAGSSANAGSPTWTPPRTIVTGDDFFVNWADFPSMFELADGTLAAHWPRRSGEGTFEYDVEVAWSPDGGDTWSEPVIPHRDGTLSEHGFVSLFPWEDGSLGAVWLDGRHYVGWDEEAGAPSGEGRPDHPEMTLRFTTLTPTGLGPEKLLDGRICECCQTSAAITSRGPIVVYRNRTEDEIRDTWTVRYVDGAWTEPAPVYEDGWEIRACPVNGPMVAADGDRVAVAWFTAAHDQPRVRLAFSHDAGESFEYPVQVDDGDPMGRVAVTLLDDGDALVTWLERTGDDAAVRIRRVTPDGTLGPSETVALSSPARASGFPRMARSGDHLVFAWTDILGEEGSRVRTAVARVPGTGGE